MMVPNGKSISLIQSNRDSGILALLESPYAKTWAMHFRTKTCWRDGSPFHSGFAPRGQTRSAYSLQPMASVVQEKPFDKQISSGNTGSELIYRRIT